MTTMMTDQARADQEERAERERARTRVLTNAAAILGISPSDLLDRAGIKEALDNAAWSDKVFGGDVHQKYLDRIREAKKKAEVEAAEDTRVRDELLYAISCNLFTNKVGMPILKDAKKAFADRFLPDRWVAPRKKIDGVYPHPDNLP